MSQSFFNGMVFGAFCDLRSYSVELTRYDATKQKTKTSNGPQLCGRNALMREFRVIGQTGSSWQEGSSNFSNHSLQPHWAEKHLGMQNLEEDGIQQQKTISGFNSVREFYTKGFYYIGQEVDKMNETDSIMNIFITFCTWYDTLRNNWSKTVPKQPDEINNLIILWHF